MSSDEKFKVVEFMNPDGKSVETFREASIAVGLLGEECELAWPVSCNELPADTKVGDVFSKTEGVWVKCQR